MPRDCSARWSSCTPAPTCCGSIPARGRWRRVFWRQWADAERRRLLAAWLAGFGAVRAVFPGGDDSATLPRPNWNRGSPSSWPPAARSTTALVPPGRRVSVRGTVCSARPWPARRPAIYATSCISTSIMPARRRVIAMSVAAVAARPIGRLSPAPRVARRLRRGATAPTPRPTMPTRRPRCS